MLQKRRKAFKLKDWAGYAEIVQHELDMERIKYLDVVNYSLDYFSPPVPEGAYKSSFMKYTMNRNKDL